MRRLPRQVGGYNVAQVRSRVNVGLGHSEMGLTCQKNGA